MDRHETEKNGVVQIFGFFIYFIVRKAIIYTSDYILK